MAGIIIGLTVEVPLTEVGRCIASISEGRGEHLFLFVDVTSNSESTRSVVCSAGHYGGSSWCAAWCSCIKPVHPETITSHSIKVRCLHERVTVVPRLGPAHVIGHEEDHVRFRFGDFTTRKCEHTADQNNCLSGRFKS